MRSKRFLNNLAKPEDRPQAFLFSAVTRRIQCFIVAQKLMTAFFPTNGCRAVTDCKSGGNITNRALFKMAPVLLENKVTKYDCNRQFIRNVVHLN